MRYRRAERLRVNGNARRASSTGGDTLSYWLKTGRREINADFHRRMTRGVPQDLPLAIRGGNKMRRPLECGVTSSRHCTRQPVQGCLDWWRWLRISVSLLLLASYSDNRAARGRAHPSLRVQRG